MKKKTYTTGEWILMIGTGVFIAACVIILMGGAVFIGKTEGLSISVHGPGARRFATIFFWCMVGGGIVLGIASTAAARRCRELLNSWNGEDSPKLDRLEKQMDIMNYLFEFFFVAILLSVGVLYYIYMGEVGEEEVTAVGPEPITPILPAGLIYVCSAVVLRGFQKNMQDEMNKLLENQSGQVYSSAVYGKETLNQWMQDSDEGQRQIVYKAAFRVYRNTVRVLFFAMNISLITVALPGVGIKVFLTIGIIWLFMTAGFCIERNRLRRQKLQ